METELARYFKAERGRLVRMAQLTRLKPGYLSQIAAGKKKCMPAYVPAIEVASGYLVRRWHLRPDDWYRIWPELPGEQGAPLCPSDGEQEAAHVG